MLRVLDLFSGIGGFSLGLERAGVLAVPLAQPRVAHNPAKIQRANVGDKGGSSKRSGFQATCPARESVS